MNYFNYDTDNEVQQSIIDQILDHCPQLADVKDPETEVLSESDKAALWKQIYKIISRFSSANCWDKGGCETFLKGERTQKMKFTREHCKSCGNLLKISPEFEPICLNDAGEPDITEINIYAVSDVRKKYTYPAELLGSSYVEVAEQFYIDLNIDMLNTQTGETENWWKNCGCCEPEFFIEIKYNAGFDKIPECLLDMFCKLLCFIKADALGCANDKGACAQMSVPQWGSYLKSESHGDVKYTYEVADNKSTQLIDEFMGLTDSQALYCLNRCGVSASQIWLGDTVYDQSTNPIFGRD